MKTTHHLTWLIGLVVLPFVGQSQILISLLFGDKLNSDGVEFGLDGGYTLADVAGDPAEGMRSALHLGMYFDIRLSEPWYLHTGFIVRSPGGVSDFQPYVIDDPNLDPYVSDAATSRRLRYIHLPAFLRYRYYKTWFIEAGPQVGFLRDAEDRFNLDLQDGKDELEYKRDILSNYNRWDAGMTIGAGGKFFGEDGFTIGVRYYWGLTDIAADPNVTQYNRIFYVFMSIPVGGMKDNPSAND